MTLSDANNVITMAISHIEASATFGRRARVIRHQASLQPRIVGFIVYPLAWPTILLHGYDLTHPRSTGSEPERGNRVVEFLPLMPQRL